MVSGIFFICCCQLLSGTHLFNGFDSKELFATENDHRHISLKVPDVEFDFNVWFLTLMH